MWEFENLKMRGECERVGMWKMNLKMGKSMNNNNRSLNGGSSG